MAKKAAEKKKKPVQPRTDGYFKVPRITGRDFVIFEMCKVQGLRQKDVAAKHGITQPRVSKIVNKVAQYLSTNCPVDYFELPREKRLVTLFRTHRMRLEHVFEEAMAAWNKSKEGQHRCKFKPLKGEPGKDELVERIVTNRHGDQRHLNTAMKWADRLLEFEGFDRRGHVDTTVAGRVYEAPDATEIEVMRMVKERVYKGQYDTEGDKGPPEWFLQKYAAPKPVNTYKPYIPDEIIFPTSNVMKAPNAVRTPPPCAITNTQTALYNANPVLNNTNITAENRGYSSQAVPQQQVATSASTKTVLYPTMPPVASPISPPVRSPEPARSGNAARVDTSHELPICTREEAKRRGLMMWREPEKDLKALPYMIAGEWK